MIKFGCAGTVPPLPHSETVLIWLIAPGTWMMFAPAAAGSGMIIWQDKGFLPSAWVVA